MSKRKALFIIEGDKTERQFLDRVIRNYPEILADYHVIGTNLFDLNNRLCSTIGADWLSDGQKVVKVLISTESLSGTRDAGAKTLDVDSFADIFLVFDYEKLGTSFSSELLLRMQHFFSDSTRNGLLLLNYPMVEAYKHLKCIPDAEYIARTYNTALGEHYKTIVGRESKYTDLRKYDKAIISYIFHINKLKLDTYTEPTMNLSERLCLFLQHQIIRPDVLVEFTTILFLELYNVDIDMCLDNLIHETGSRAQQTNLFTTNKEAPTCFH